MNSPLEPGISGIAWASLLMAALLLAAHLNGIALLRRGLLAATRSAVQLTAVGLVLDRVFAIDEAFLVLGILCVMVFVAGATADSQIKRVVGRLWLVLCAVLVCVTLSILLFVTHWVLQLPELSARYAIPLGGIVLGNAMTAATLAANRYFEHLSDGRARVETALSLGASPAQADLPAFTSSFLTAVTPVLNAMLIVGIVKLPGIMSGQMLGGSQPWIAAQYQLVVMFMLACGDGLTALWVLRILRRRVFSTAWQLKI